MKNKDIIFKAFSYKENKYVYGNLIKEKSYYYMVENDNYPYIIYDFEEENSVTTINNTYIHPVNPDTIKIFYEQ